MMNNSRHYLVIKVVEVIEVNSCRECPALWVQDVGSNLHYRCEKMDAANVRFNLREEDLDTMAYNCPLEWYSTKEIEEMINSS